MASWPAECGTWLGGGIWIGIITVLFCLPEISPVSWHTFNYAPIAVGVVLALSGGWLLISARRWFTGPHRQVAEAELKAIEQSAVAAVGHSRAGGERV